MQKHRKTIQVIQWVTILFYLLLLIIPAFMALPPRQAHILNNFTLFSQFVFWGIWWPFVIFSMLPFGRLWCGIFCPEGALSEWVSRKAQLNRTIPRWFKWRGWPATTFVFTTLYGQLISVYDYAQATLLILGGSTVGAMMIGFFFGRGRRVWCRYFCPVSGVFNLLSRLSPISFKTDEKTWNEYNDPLASAPECPPMISIRQLKGISACHMCGRCTGYRNAVALKLRSCNEEIMKYGDQKNNVWEMRLLLYGMIGIAIGAFTWTINPWFVQFKLVFARWLVERNILWPLNATAPWWLLTHYSENNDSLNWLDGFCITTYILGSGLLFGSVLSFNLSFVTFLIHKGRAVIKQHLAQTFLPLATASLFLGLTTTTVKLLQYSGITFYWLNGVRAFILSGASLWSLYLGANVLTYYQITIIQWVACFCIIGFSVLAIIMVWVLTFWVW
ncbi:MAG: polyferredoxin [Candidatus Tokpelaia sp. JSC188]|nr:MAG: polyferredoxin [Candidatus Tokpelaia sp. JSC188]